jgi:hypothetical protein
MQSVFAAGRRIKAFLVEAAIDTNIFYIGLRRITGDGQAVTVSR